jgi:hypothetical protein
MLTTTAEIGSAKSNLAKPETLQSLRTLVRGALDRFWREKSHGLVLANEPQAFAGWVHSGRPILTTSGRPAQVSPY